MRRRVLGLWVLMVVGALAGASTAGAAPPPLTSIAPANGAQLPLGTPLFETLRFGCPSYTEGTSSRDYHEYSYRVTDSPAEESGQLDFVHVVAEGSALPLAPGECTALTEGPIILSAGLYYWRSIRGGALLGEYGPVWSFRIGSTKPTVSTECASKSKGLSKGPVCPAGSLIAARFTSPISTSYVLCVKAPGKARHCFPSKTVQAEAESQRILPNSGSGSYTITWKANGAT